MACPRHTLPCASPCAHVQPHAVPVLPLLLGHPECTWSWKSSFRPPPQGAAGRDVSEAVLAVGEVAREDPSVGVRDRPWLQSHRTAALAPVAVQVGVDEAQVTAGRGPGVLVRTVRGGGYY